MEIHHLKAESIEPSSEVSMPVLGVAANYAEVWYRDSIRELVPNPTKDNKRREIVFSVCFLETYIFEWVRNYGNDFIDRFFDISAKNRSGERYCKNFKSKWKLIIPDMVKEFTGNEDKSLDLSELGMLLKFRNGLVHASASRITSIDIERGPEPSQEEIDDQESGWAISIAERLVFSLHELMNTEAPNYLTS